MNRSKKNKNLVYGTRAVLESIHSDQDVDKILVLKSLNNQLVRELLEVAARHKIPVQRVPIQKLKRLGNKNHQGVVGLLSAISYYSLDHVISQAYAKGEAPLIVVLDRVTDVRNFGAIARTADAAGAHALIIGEKGQAQITEDALKTSAGALNYIPVCRVPDLSACLIDLQQQGLQIVACTEKSPDTIYQCDLNLPTALVLGSEENGIGIRLLKISDKLVKIPMKGNIASLNVSVAAAIGLFECVRQRSQFG